MLVEGIDQYPGFPSQPPAIVAGMNSTYDDSTPYLTANQDWWDDVSYAASKFWDLSGEAGHAIVEGVKEGYETISSGVGRVADDLSGGISRQANTLLNPVERAVGFSTMTIVILVGALGAALYFAGKTGGLRVSI